jgi:hypothetical protein
MQIETSKEYADRNKKSYSKIVAAIIFTLVRISQI